MRAFVLCTGRCGSRTFARACATLDNYTSGHETRAGRVDARLAYPDGHIEVDNRLSWFLGPMEYLYGDDPVYVHLTRDPDKVIASYARRYHVDAGIMPAFASGIIRRRHADRYALESAELMIKTITMNITAFLVDKTKAIEVPIEAPHVGFDRMCQMLGAHGDFDAAHGTLDVVHGASTPA